MQSELKEVTSRDLVDIVSELLTNPMAVEQLVNDRQYSKLMVGITKAITSVCGGEVYGTAEYEDDNELYVLNVGWTEDVPNEGGIWNRVDMDIDWSCELDEE